MLKLARADDEPQYRDILSRLNPRQGVEDLHRLADPHEPVLLCWERPPPSETVWRHRRRVAAWLHETLGWEVPEIEPVLAPGPQRRTRRAAERANSARANLIPVIPPSMVGFQMGPSAPRRDHRVAGQPPHTRGQARRRRAWPAAPGAAVGKAVRPGGETRLKREKSRSVFAGGPPLNARA
jgi:hypothetical protein